MQLLAVNHGYNREIYIESLIYTPGSVEIYVILNWVSY